MTHRQERLWACVIIGMLLAIIVLTPPARSFTATAYAPLPSSAFLPISPLDRPIRSTVSPSAGHSAGAPDPSTVARSSTRPSSRPITVIVPPAVAWKGVATYQPLPGLYGSAGPVLRAAGVRVGQTVLVCARPEHEGFSSCVHVTIWPGGCWCKPRRDGPDLIDLSAAAFAKLAPLSQGVVDVVVSW